MDKIRLTIQGSKFKADYEDIEDSFIASGFMEAPEDEGEWLKKIERRAESVMNVRANWSSYERGRAWKEEDRWTFPLAGVLWARGVEYEFNKEYMRLIGFKQAHEEIVLHVSGDEVEGTEDAVKTLLSLLVSEEGVETLWSGWVSSEKLSYRKELFAEIEAQVLGDAAPENVIKKRKSRL